MNPTVTISLDGHDHQGRKLSAQTAFAFSQRHTPEALATIERLHKRLMDQSAETPKGTLCTDGFIRIRKV